MKNKRALWGLLLIVAGGIVMVGLTGCKTNPDFPYEYSIINNTTTTARCVFYEDRGTYIRQLGGEVVVSKPYLPETSTLYRFSCEAPALILKVKFHNETYDDPPHEVLITPDTPFSLDELDI
jgi:hypothetical protein